MNDKKKRYRERKTRMDKDPEYRDKILRAQADSRRRTRSKVEAPCLHEYPGGRRCWKEYLHTHGGQPAPLRSMVQEIDRRAREIVANRQHRTDLGH